MNTKRNYLLLTPGPLSTSETVREAMLQDWCTWDKDYNEGIVTPIRKGLLAIAGLDEDEYTDVLLQGSGTYCVEATIGAAVKPTDKLLILANGAYGKRMAQIAEYYHIDHVLISLHETELVNMVVFCDLCHTDQRSGPQGPRSQSGHHTSVDGTQRNDYRPAEPDRRSGRSPEGS